MYQMSSGSRKMTGKLERATQADPMSSNERNNGNDGNNGSELVGEVVVPLQRRTFDSWQRLLIDEGEVTWLPWGVVLDEATLELR
eukprot:gene50802-52634_t